jgi:dihydrofolate reductase
MAKIVGDLTMSLDGFIAHPDDTVGHIFDWFQVGPVEVPSAEPNLRFSVDEASAPLVREMFDNCGAIVAGRRLFDVTNGWDGRHPVGAPIFVVTHQAPEGWRPKYDLCPVTFVTDGVASAIRQAGEAAGEREVGVAGPNIIQQCLNLGLLDELRVHIAPVLIGAGIRFFDNLEHTPVLLDDPEVVNGTRVTHLRYRVRRNVGASA